MLYCDSMSQALESMVNDKTTDSECWSEKCNVTLTALSQEYYSYIDAIRQTDEKSNKYMFIISVVVAGIFTVMTSSLTDKLSFNANPLTGQSLLSWLFIVSLMTCLCFGFLIVQRLLQGLSFVKTARLPDLAMELDEHKNKSSGEYKKLLVDNYQEAVNILYNALLKKQQVVNSSIEYMPHFLCSVSTSFIILFIIKLIGE